MKIRVCLRVSACVFQIELKNDWRSLIRFYDEFFKYYFYVSYLFNHFFNLFCYKHTELLTYDWVGVVEMCQNYLRLFSYCYSSL